MLSFHQFSDTPLRAHFLSRSLQLLHNSRQLGRVVTTQLDPRCFSRTFSPIETAFINRYIIIYLSTHHFSTIHCHCYGAPYSLDTVFLGFSIQNLSTLFLRSCRFPEGSLFTPIRSRVCYSEISSHIWPRFTYGAERGSRRQEGKVTHGVCPAG